MSPSMNKFIYHTIIITFVIFGIEYVERFDTEWDYNIDNARG